MAALNVVQRVLLLLGGPIDIVVLPGFGTSDFPPTLLHSESNRDAIVAPIVLNQPGRRSQKLVLLAATTGSDALLYIVSLLHILTIYSNIYIYISSYLYT